MCRSRGRAGLERRCDGELGIGFVPRINIASWRTKIEHFQQILGLAHRRPRDRSLGKSSRPRNLPFSFPEIIGILKYHAPWNFQLPLLMFWESMLTCLVRFHSVALFLALSLQWTHVAKKITEKYRKKLRGENKVENKSKQELRSAWKERQDCWRCASLTNGVASRSTH